MDIGVAIVLALLLGGCALVGWGAWRISGRAEALGRTLLERALDDQITRVMTLLNSFEQSIEGEMVYLQTDRSISDRELIRRWAPVLRSRPAIRTIGVADEPGNERSLNLGPRNWTFTVTRLASEVLPPQVSQWPVTTPGDTTHRIGDRSNNPRESVWFSQALEERHGDPVWSVDKDPATGAESMNVSVLIRSDRDEEPYRILRFSLDPAVLMRTVRQETQGTSTLQLSTTGQPYEPFPDTPMGTLWRTVLERWDRGRHSSAFPVSVNGNSYLAQIIPRTMKGTEVLAAGVVDLGPIERSLRVDRITVWSAGLILVLLVAILMRMYLRSLRTHEEVRKQERRSRNRDRQLAKALGERDILDREVHHRVKNNLQVLSSLLNLQLQRMEEGRPREEFIRGKNRIDAMALVHHKLYALSDLRSIALGPFLDELTKGMATMFDPRSRNVSHAVQTGGLRCDTDTAILLGMILFELVANCYQHAFPYSTGGHIDITVRYEGPKHFRLSVRDNGTGIQADGSRRSTMLGMEIVEALADQLDGTVEVSGNGGTLVEVTFKPNEVNNARG